MTQAIATVLSKTFVAVRPGAKLWMLNHGPSVRI